MSTPKIPNRLTPVYGVVFLDLLGFGIVIPILPYYAQTFGASGWELGMLMACFSFFQFLFGPIWGHLSDRVGRKKVLLVTVLGTAFGYGMIGSAWSLTSLLVARSLAGIFSANLSAAQAMVSESTEGEMRARALGLIGAALGMGFLLGPPLGGALTTWGYGAPLYFSAALALINGVFVWKKLPDFPPKSRSESKPSLYESFKVVTQAPASLLAVGLYFAFTLALTQMEVSFALSLQKRFELEALGTGLLMAAMGVAMATMQMKGVRWARARWSQALCIAFGLAFFAAGLISLGVSPHLFGVGIGIALAAIGQSLIQPNLSAAASETLAPELHGLAYGVYQSAGSLARIIGPLSAGATIHFFHSEVPFLTGASLLLLLLSLWILPSKRWSPIHAFSFKT